MRESLLNLLDEWQDRLGLQDWAIVLRTNCSNDDLISEDAENQSGEVEWTLQCKSAIIRLKSFDDINQFIIPTDYEKTLVHELLHLKFALIQVMCQTELEHEHMHQLLNDMARAMVDSKHGRTGRKLSCARFKDMVVKN